MTDPSSQCAEPIDLGVKYDYKSFILDKQITASSFTTEFEPGNGRLFYKGNWQRRGGWKPLHNNQDSWLQVDFERDTVLLAESTQGWQDPAGVKTSENQWQKVFDDAYVKTYTLSYSNDGFTFHDYRVCHKDDIIWANLQRRFFVQ